MSQNNIQRISTMDGFEVNPTRASGNTTRQVDKAIEIIFSGNVCVVEDHADYITREASRRLFGLIMNRLKYEHPVVFENCLKSSTSDLTIRLYDGVRTKRKPYMWANLSKFRPYGSKE